MDVDVGELDALVVRVRADTSGFMSGLADIRRELDGPLAQGAERAGGGIERSLARAAVSGRLGFEDLRRVALRALSDIAAGAVRNDLSGLFGGGNGGGGGGVIGALGGAISGLLGGAPGRATGGPVSAGLAYRVGERGPEMFVPTSAGRVEAAGAGGGAFGQRPVQVTVNVAAPREANAAVMQQTGAQVARAVRRALMQANG